MGNSMALYQDSGPSLQPLRNPGSGEDLRGAHSPGHGMAEAVVQESHVTHKVAYICDESVLVSKSVYTSHYGLIW